MSNEVVVKQVKKFPYYDIFVGEGWKNWTRIMYVKGHAAFLGGNRLPIRQVYAIMDHFLKTNNGGSLQARVSSEVVV